MTKIPFDIKYRPQIESGEYKVETRDGRKARIVHWDLNCTSPIVGVMDAHIDLPGEIVDVFSVSGRAFDNLESPSDLFLVTPEEELSEFEKVVAKYRPQSDTKETIQRIASELLACARKEALKDLPRWKKANGKERLNERLIVLAGDNDLLCTNYAEDGEYYIPFSDLEKLPKED